MRKKSIICHITKKPISLNKAKSGFSIRSSILEIIREKYSDFKDDDYISDDELNKFKVEHIKRIFERDKGKITEIEQQVAESVAKHDFMSVDFTDEEDDKTSFGEMVSDKIAEFGGSWKFILSFLGFMAVWIVLNVVFLSSKSFDPYPFILLNLILSCVASLQAPVIMMSQNRSEAKDRKRGINDFKVNLKAEIEIRHLHEKMDHLINNQVNHIHEIQELQIDLLDEINDALKSVPKKSRVKRKKK